jgi:hypothetical protein
MQTLGTEAPIGKAPVSWWSTGWQCIAARQVVLQGDFAPYVRNASRTGARGCRGPCCDSAKDLN